MSLKIYEKDNTIKWKRFFFWYYRKKEKAVHKFHRVSNEEEGIIAIRIS